MATPTPKATTKTIYVTLKPQRLQIDGKVAWYPIGSEIDPKWIHPRQLLRMVKLGFLKEEVVPLPAKVVAAPVIPPVAPGK